MKLFSFLALCACCAGMLKAQKCSAASNGTLSYTVNRTWTTAYFSFQPLEKMSNVRMEARQVFPEGKQISLKAKFFRKMSVAKEYLVHELRNGKYHYVLDMQFSDGRTACFDISAQPQRELIRRGGE